MLVEELIEVLKKMPQDAFISPIRLSVEAHHFANGYVGTLEFKISGKELCDAFAAQVMNAEISYS